ncbi:sigma factor [Microbispora siamensis]
MSEGRTGAAEPIAGGGGMDPVEDPATEAFVAHRNLLFTVAYEMLGSAADAEDVLQETWLRWAAHRARAHVAARRPRDVVSPNETRDALQAFQQAVETGDLQRLLDILAPDVVLLSDGGGIKKALAQPVVGAGKVARLLAAGLDRFGTEVSVEPVQVNGHPGLVMRIDGEIDGVVAMRIEDGLVAGLYFVRNPDKLSRVERETALSR